MVLVKTIYTLLTSNLVVVLNNSGGISPYPLLPHYTTNVTKYYTYTK